MDFCPPLLYLWSHAADSWHVVASIQEVCCVTLQLEFTQPIVNSFSILGRQEINIRRRDGETGQQVPTIASQR